MQSLPTTLPIASTPSLDAASGAVLRNLSAHSCQLDRVACAIPSPLPPQQYLHQQQQQQQQQQGFAAHHSAASNYAAASEYLAASALSGELPHSLSEAEVPYNAASMRGHERCELPQLLPMPAQLMEALHHQQALEQHQQGLPTHLTPPYTQQQQQQAFDMALLRGHVLSPPHTRALFSLPEE